MNVENKQRSTTIRTSEKGIERKQFSAYLALSQSKTEFNNMVCNNHNAWYNNQLQCFDSNRRPRLREGIKMGNASVEDKGK